MSTKAVPRYLMIAALLMIMVNYPMLSAANKPLLVGGIPLLYVYIGSVWVIAIVLLYITTRRYQK